MMPVLIRYAAGSFCDLSNYIMVSNRFISVYLFKIRYLYLIAVFLAVSIAVLRRANADASVERRRRDSALVCATWLSLLAPLSWIVIFKAHSFVHAGINFILWQMPFTFFGFALCGVACRNVFRKRWSRLMP